MARRSIFQKLKNETIEAISDCSEASFSHSELQSFLEEKVVEWLESSTYSRRYANLLIKGVLDNKILIPVNYIKSGSGEKKTLYAKSLTNYFAVTSGLKRNSYFSHYSAMFLHNLTLQIPKTIFLNSERSSRQENTSSRSSLKQENIDLAFANSQRKTSNYYSSQGKRVYILNGQNTNKLGVFLIIEKEGEYYCTDLERTLIDIAIRPAYAGGVFEVLEAFEKAKNKVDVAKMKEYLDALNYIYPYHQTIGFYLQKAGFPSSAFKSFQKDMLFDFYLTYNIKLREYSKEWKLFYPKGF